MPETRVRVLHIVNALGLGGTEKVMQLFATHLNPSRFHVAAFAFQDGQRGPQLRKAGIPTHVTDDLLGVLDTFRPHVVHVHRAGWPEPNLLRPLRMAGVPVVVETNVFGRHDPSPHAAVIDRTLFVSRFCLNRFHATTGIPENPDRYSFLYNPVDTDFLSSASCRDRDFSRAVIGRISRADPGKWSRMALDILPLLAHDLPDFRCRIIGGIPEAVRFVAENNLENHVAFLPAISTDAEIADFMNSISVLAHANDTGESFGLVIAEAMACGLPVVTHPCPGLRDNAQLELVDHGETGLVANTAEEYAKAVVRLLSHPEEARRMGRNGQEKASRLYRVQTVTRQLESIYGELLAAKGIHA
ncbi:glycosyltransferase family 4 protein [Pseudodesulfovibrio tunisiensis]|uniref:glycosyltransferase family 4 protein n=1 Tax=Pseudodesulfovibrio tunisiensis TaxID=463192 RepID=UPI001FB488E6|nr:glycosyltransferase family 4 protein [Pseudodesulfovibrio tunisiensis]